MGESDRCGMRAFRAEQASQRRPEHAPAEAEQVSGKCERDAGCAWSSQAGPAAVSVSLSLRIDVFAKWFALPDEVAPAPEG
jgi:hypothetical protein